MSSSVAFTALREVTELREIVEAQAKLLAALQHEIATLKGKNK